VGWHLHHPLSFHPFYRAGLNYRHVSVYSDWVKPNVYPAASGGRSRSGWFNGILNTLFKDLRPEIGLGFLYDILGYDPDQMPSVEDYLSDDPVPGWNDDYVFRETQRALAGFGNVPVYPGLGFDLPAGGDTPESVEACTRAVFNAGAPGVLLSREYEEMKVEHLQAVGRAMKGLGLLK
jgi:hypothetical protein